MSSGKRCSSLFWRFAFGSVIDALDEVANNVFVDGGGAEKSILNGTLAAFGTRAAVGAAVSGLSACPFCVRTMTRGERPTFPCDFA